MDIEKAKIIIEEQHERIALLNEERDAMRALMDGSHLIMLERERQKQHGYDLKNDLKYSRKELANAAMIRLARYVPAPFDGDWEVGDFKQTTRFGALVQAGAFIAAEIDRIIYEEKYLHGTATNKAKAEGNQAEAEAE